MERGFDIMVKEGNVLKIKNTITNEDKQMLRRALDGINGWNFNPVAVVTNEDEDYYFICKVKSGMKKLQMQMAKIHIKVKKDDEPKLLTIEIIK